MEQNKLIGDLLKRLWLSAGFINGAVITTRGDANEIPDPWQLQLTGPTVERAVAVVPYVGWSAQLQGPLLLAAAATSFVAVLVVARKEVGARLLRA